MNSTLTSHFVLNDLKPFDNETIDLIVYLQLIELKNFLQIIDLNKLLIQHSVS